MKVTCVLCITEIAEYLLILSIIYNIILNWWSESELPILHVINMYSVSA